MGLVYGLEQGAFDEEILAEQVGGGRFPVHLASRFHQAYLQHLAGVVPLVDRLVNVQTLVALEADEVGAQSLGQGTGDLRLPDAGLAL